VATTTGAVNMRGSKGTQIFGNSVQVKGDTGVDIN